MFIQLIGKVIKRRIKNISFPKLPTKEFNKLWKISQLKFISLPILEIVSILRCLILKFGTVSLLTIQAVFYIVKASGILEEKDTKDHFKMVKALDVDKTRLDFFIGVSLVFSIVVRLINLIVWLIWLPL